MKRTGIKLVLIVLLSLALVGGMVGWGITSIRSQSPSFQAEGYLLHAQAADGAVEVQTIEFARNTRYKRNARGEVSFQQISGEPAQYRGESFIHYGDGSLAAFSAGVLLDTSSMQAGALTYYALPAQTVLAKNGSSYTTDNNGNALNFKDFVYKLAEDKYLLASQRLVLHLPDGTEQSIRDFAELTYLEEGVAQVLCQDGAWQFLTANARITLANGADISLATGEIMAADGAKRLSLGEITLGAETAVTIDNSEEWIPPVFNITAQDGQSGESGEDGEEGAQGETGQTGETGETGETGAGGLNGPSGSSVGAMAVTMASMNLVEFTPTAGSVSFGVQVNKGDWDLMDAAQKNTVGTVELWNMNKGLPCG